MGHRNSWILIFSLGACILNYLELLNITKYLPNLLKHWRNYDYGFPSHILDYFR